MEFETSDPTPVDLIIEESHSVDDSSLEPSDRTRGASYDIIERDYNSANLRERARYRGYGVYGGQSNTDPWVRQTLKTFDRDVYEDIYGFTRRPEGTLGMYRSLKEFASDNKNEFHHLNRHQRRCMIQAIKKAKKAFKLPWKREPLDWHEIGAYFRRDTAAGVTFMGQKKGDCMEEIYHETRWLAHRMKQDGKRFNPTNVRFPPALAGQRGAMSESDSPKTRLVWVYPAEMLAVEGQYAPRMYHDYMADPNSPMLNGKSSQRLYTEWCVNLREGETLYGLDFSKFDTKVPSWLIRVAFSILRQNIDFSMWKGKNVSKRDAAKWRNVWDSMVWYFINTPILMPDGRLFRKYRGVPSGSWWTQMIDSVVNYILVDYLAACQNADMRNLRVLGDDSAFRCGSDFDLTLAQKDADVIGMVLKPEKCEKTIDPVEFKLLGTTYRGGRPHRPTVEWFKLALYPEGSVSSLEVSLTRLIGLWLGGAMWDTKFCSFMDYFQSSYPCPEEGWFSKDQRRWLEVVYSGKAPRGWTTKKSLFWRSIFYTFG